MSSRGKNFNRQNKANQHNLEGGKLNKFSGTRNQRQWKHNNNNWRRTHWSKRRSRNPVPYENQFMNMTQHAYNYNPNFASTGNDFMFNFDPINEGHDKDGPVLPGSAEERRSKVELDKKRLLHALNSGHDEGQQLCFNKSLNNIEEKEESQNNRNNINLSELRLTANDLMEIGAVAGKSTEKNDLENNSTLETITPAYKSQWLSNVSNTNGNIPQKTHNTNNWKSFQIPTDFNNSEISQVNFLNTSNQNYTQREEKILGDILPHREPLIRPIENKVINQTDSVRIGRLYKSFLKARYFGGKFNLSDKEKSLNTTSLLGKSTAEIHSTSLNTLKKQGESFIAGLKLEEPTMPLPIKIENTYRTETGINEEKEADEFLLEFSHLLCSDMIIPDDTLKQLGLDYLLEQNPYSEMNINNKKQFNNSVSLNSCDTTLNKSESILRVKSISALNSSVISDDLISQPTDKSQRNNSSPAQMVIRQNMTPQSNSQLSREHNHMLKTFKENENCLDIEKKQDQLNVEEILTEVVERFCDKLKEQPNVANRSLLQPGIKEVQSKLKDTIGAIVNNQPSDQQNSNQNDGQYRLENNPNEVSLNNQLFMPNQISTPTTSRNDDVTSCSQNCSSKNQLEGVSNKIIRMFHIDKKIQELIEEKMKLYNDLMAIKEIASTFFDSWAKEKQATESPYRSNTTNNISSEKEMEDVPQRGKGGTDLDINNFLKALTSNGKSNLSLLSDKEENLQGFLNNLEAVKQYLTSFETNAVSTIASSWKNQLVNIKKEVVVSDQNSQSSNSTRLNTDIKNGGTSKKKQSTKRKNSEPPLSTENQSSKKQHPSQDLDLLPNIENIENEDGIVEISDDEKYMELFETKFEPSNIPKNDELMNKDLPKKSMKKHIFEFESVNATVLCIKISETHQICVTGCKGGELLMFSLTSGKLKGKLEGHKETVTCLSEHNGLIISGSTDSKLHCFHIKTKTLLYTINVGYPVQCMDLKYGLLFVGTKAGILFTYSVKETLQMIDEPLTLGDSSILAVKAAKEGVRKILIVAARGQQITVRDATTGLLIRIFNWCDTVYCLEVNGENPFVFCGTNNKGVIAVNYIDGEETFRCNVGRGVSHLCFYQDLLFSACYNGRVYIYDCKKKNLITNILVTKGMLLSLIVYKNQVIVSSSRNQLLIVPFPEELTNYLLQENR